MNSNEKYDYHQVSDDKEDGHEASSPPHSETTYRRQAVIYTVIAAGSSVLTLAILLMVYYLSLGSSTSGFRYASNIDVDCGKTVDQARAIGCQFDMMASRWEHPLCHDAELLSEVLADGPWEWYEDRNHTVHVPRSEVAKGNFPHHYLHIKPDYHIGHW